jgi:hypothetical protein
MNMLSALPDSTLAQARGPLRVACVGLDVLHRVRLKVAVSLLMADLIQAELLDDDGQPVDLLVGDADDGHAQQRLLAVAREGGAVLAISRSGSDGNPARLAQGASVREIHQQLIRLLGSFTVPGPGPVAEPLPGRTLFHWLARFPGQDCLLHNGLVKLVVDAARQQVCLLRELPLGHYAQQAVTEGWSCEVLNAAELARARADAVGYCSWETLCWQVAVSIDTPLPAAQVPDAMRLQGWPDIAVDKLPAGWLLPIAGLLQRRWNLRHLGNLGGIDGLDVQRIAAAASWSGLGLNDVQAAEPVAVVPLASTGLLARIARRFGLSFTPSPARH